MTVMTEGALPSGWRAEEIERVDSCPCCRADGSLVAHRGVKDWSFGSDSGEWLYRQCTGCGSLYLDPRPREECIGRVYGAYYTHSVRNEGARFREKLQNECFFHWYGMECRPRLLLPPSLAPVLNLLRPFVYVPFPLRHLHRRPGGTLLDVGCGNGDLIDKAQRMGWRVAGLEIDERAVSAATGRGLAVAQGSYRALAGHAASYDCVVCSHVIEHVHNPRLLIRLLLGVTKPGGVIYLALPNPQSLMRSLFGKYWRGLEAPRHVTLPSVAALARMFAEEGADDVTVHPTPVHTFGESMRLRFGKVGTAVKVVNKVLNSATTLCPFSHRQDVIEIEVRKK